MSDFVLAQAEGQCLHVGLSTDTKPDPDSGHLFMEGDTSKVFVANGVSWVYGGLVAGSFATAAQGTTADSALQPAGNGSSLTGLTKTQVGLANADNTSDAAKPVSTAQQTALDLKANLASPTFTGTVGGVTATMVGLGSVNNTSDAAKPVSTATQTALDAKQVSGSYATGAQGALADTALQTDSALGTPVSGVATNLTGTAASLTAGNATLAATVTTNANLTGHVTSTGNAAVLGSFTIAQLSTAISDANISGNNSGDQTSIVGISGTLAEFNTALSDANFASGGGTVTGASSGTNTGDQNLAPYATLDSPTFTGTVVIPTPFTIGAVSMTATGTELNFVDGVTSAIQTQIDSKQATLVSATNIKTINGATVLGSGDLVVAGVASDTSTIVLAGITSTILAATCRYIVDRFEIASTGILEIASGGSLEVG